MVQIHGVVLLVLTGVAIRIHSSNGDDNNECEDDILKLSDMGMSMTHEIDYLSASCEMEMFDWSCNYYEDGDIKDTLSNCSSWDGTHVNITTSKVCDNGYFKQGTYITGPWCVPNSCDAEEAVSNKMWDLQEDATTNGCDFNFTMVVPSASPTLTLSQTPSDSPSLHPSLLPTDIPSGTPSLSQPPSALHSANPSFLPSDAPSTIPSGTPSIRRTSVPSITPSLYPTDIHIHTHTPTINPTSAPTRLENIQTSGSPSITTEPPSVPSLQSVQLTDSNFTTNFVVRSFLQTPRFGHSPQFSHLFTPSLKTDYLLGILFLPSLTTAAFLLWTALLLFFICLGPKRVGYLSGYSMSYGKTYPTNVKYMHREGRGRPGVVRGVFLCGCLGVVGMTAVGYRSGWTEVMGSFDVLWEDAPRELRDIADRGQNLTHAVSILARRSDAIHNNVITDLQNMSFCRSDNNDGSDSFRHPEKESVLAALRSLGDFGVDMGSSFDTELFSWLRQKSEAFPAPYHRYKVLHWIPLASSISVAVMALAMALGTVMSCHRGGEEGGARTKRFQNFLTWLVLPLFIVFVVFSWCVLGVAGLGIVMNADACSGGAAGSPDGTVMDILQESNQTGLVTDAVTSWVGGCRSGYPFPTVTHFISNLDEATAATQSFTSSIENCDESDASYVRPYFQRLKTNMDTISNDVRSLHDLLSCETLTPLYTHTTHDTLCARLPHAAFWLWLGATIVSFLGMTAITLRASWLDVETENDRVSDADADIDDANGSGVGSILVLGMTDISDGDEENPRTEKERIDTAQLQKKERRLQKEWTGKGDVRGRKDKKKVGAKDLDVPLEKPAKITKDSSSKKCSLSTMSWEKYPVKPFTDNPVTAKPVNKPVIDDISSRKLWEAVCVADEVALKSMPPFPTNPDFRVY